MTRTWFTDEQIARAKRLREGGYSYGEIAIRMGCAKARIHKLERRGWKRHTLADRSRPTDLALVAARLKFNECRAHYRVGAQLLRQWLNEAGVSLPDRHRRNSVRPLPDGFPEVAASMTHVELQRHYRASGRTVLRWKLEAGLPTPRHDLNQRRASAAPQARIGWAERYVATQRGTPSNEGASA